MTSLKEFRMSLPNVGRWDTRQGLEYYLKQGDYERFSILCKHRKNLIDEKWLKKLLLDECKNDIIKIKYLRVYKRIFLESSKKRGNRIYSRK